MNFIQINNKNQYQRELLIQFFDKLQTMKPFGEYGPWIVEVAISQELYFYSHRFFFPSYFLTYQKYFELEIKLQFIQSYSTESLQKTFYSHQILEC